MTHIIIGENTKDVYNYLLSIISKILGRKIDIKFLNTCPDIHILKSENIQTLGIEDVKDFQKEMVFKPFIETHQIGIVFEAEKLTTDAQNSFLKTLEEQKDSTVYILITKNEKSLLATILSRGIKHVISSKKDIAQNTFKVSNDIVEMFNNIEILSKEGNDKISQMLEEYLSTLKNELEENIRNGDDCKEVQNNIEIVNKAYERIKANGNKRLVLENMIVQLKYKSVE